MLQQNAAGGFFPNRRRAWGWGALAQSGLFVAAALFSGCTDAKRIDVRLIHAPALDTSELTSVQIRIRDLSGGFVHAARVDSLSSSTPEAFEADSLIEGRVYVVELRADAPSCRNGHASGRSRPFVHQDADYAVPIQFGCADAFSPTKTMPTTPRLDFSLATESGGTAVAVGGARSADTVGIGRLFDLPALNERYDPATGTFVPAGTLGTPRAVPTTLAVDDRGVALIGGVLSALPICSREIDFVTNDEVRPGEPLLQGRCAPAVVALPAQERVAIIGGTLIRNDRTLDVEVYDSSLVNRVASSVSASNYHAGATGLAFSDGRRGVVVGGVPPDFGQGAVAELVTSGGDCVQAACLSPLAVESAPTAGWTELAASYLSCPSGGGTAYVVGGRTGPDTTAQSLDGVWCLQDSDVAPSFAKIGALPGARHGHQMAALTGSSSAARLLVVGGLSQASGATPRPNDDALLIPVNPCRCDLIAPGAIQSIPLPFEHLVYLGAKTNLDDGSVLLIGSVIVNVAGAASRATATTEAGLFIPDVE